MRPTEIIKFPMMTEKSYARHADHVYTFQVNPRATKSQIKTAFSEIFSVKVAQVRTINHKPKLKRMGRFAGYRPAVKTAVIKLKPGFKLDFLHEEPDQKGKSKAVQPKLLNQTTHGS